MAVRYTVPRKRSAIARKSHDRPSSQDNHAFGTLRAFSMILWSVRWPRASSIAFASVNVWPRSACRRPQSATRLSNNNNCVFLTTITSTLALTMLSNASPSELCSTKGAICLQKSRCNAHEEPDNEVVVGASRCCLRVRVEFSIQGLSKSQQRITTNDSPFTTEKKLLMRQLDPALIDFAHMKQNNFSPVVRRVKAISSRVRLLRATAFSNVNSIRFTSAASGSDLRRWSFATQQTHQCQSARSREGQLTGIVSRSLNKRWFRPVGSRCRHKENPYSPEAAVLLSNNRFESAKPAKSVS